MDCLARREHSFFELKQKLQARLPDRNADEIQSELERLREENLQSDKRFVESFVRYRKSRGFGYLHIRNDLRHRFVADGLIDEVLFEDDTDWQLMAEALIQQRMTGDQLTRDSREHRRLARFLQARGFSPELVLRVLQSYLG